MQSKICPQPGPQTAFLASPADFTVFGGAAGGGKSFGLTLGAARHVRRPGYRSICFRRTAPEILAPGGLWDTAKAIYPLAFPDARSRETPRYEWSFAPNSVLKYSHLEHEKDVYAHQGAQYNFVGFDEITHFTRRQVLYMLGRLRDGLGSGVRPRAMGTCNPDPDSFVFLDFVRWYIGEDGFPIRDRCGVVRYFTNVEDKIVWGDTVAEVVKKAPHVQKVIEAGGRAEDLVMSFTFVPSKLSDNPALMRRDPAYLGKLLGLGPTERARLFDGNWFARDRGGSVFREEWFRSVDVMAPANMRRVRYWDLAGSKRRRSDWTAGVKMADLPTGRTLVEDVRNVQMIPADVESFIGHIARDDGPECEIWIEEEKGAAGQILVDILSRTTLRGFTVNGSPVGNEDKLVRSKPVSSAAAPKRDAQGELVGEAFGQIDVYRADWNRDFFMQTQAFPDSKHDDIVDSFVGAWHRLAEGGFYFRTVRR